eukprot:TRINITY_DN69274_c0_g1_i1.p1 TRINITY_DN69274_c0_g1~~TRINITY_DN69274_c0_g1_i1.p1  ORF type:complete len:285 (+),score=52.62 TRINITY_DN69274_c0_g1_i1:17-871(+)
MACLSCSDVFKTQPWPQAFGTSWALPHGALLTVRTAFAALFLSFFLWDSIDHWDDGYYFIYLTDWTLALETLYAVLLVVATFRAGKRLRAGDLDGRYLESGSSSDDEDVPLLMKIVFQLFVCVQPLCFLIALLYWTLLTPFWTLTPSTLPVWIEWVRHGANWILLLIDFWTSRLPFSVVYAIPIFFYGVSYVTWSYIDFSMRIGRYHCPDCPIYNVIDWHRPNATVPIVGGALFVGVPFVVLVYRLMFSLRSSLEARMDPEGSCSQKGIKLDIVDAVESTDSEC